MNYACREKFAGEKSKISTIGAEKPTQCPGTSANDPRTVPVTGFSSAGVKKHSAGVR